MNITKMTCINCPLGCTLSVEIDGENINVSGNRCKRGAEYAASEIRAPKRMVTSTVRVAGGDKPLVSVKTSGEIPKGRIFDVIHEINKKTAHPPIKVGDVVIEDVLGLEINIVATSNADIKKAME
jgi:CxxC motif-containing protein